MNAPNVLRLAPGSALPSGVDVLNLASDDGLLDGVRIPSFGNFKARCPHGCDDSRKVADFGCSYTADGSKWHCFRCAKGGGPGAMFRAIDREVTPRAYTSSAPPKIQRARVNVPLAWEQLQRQRGLLFKHKVYNYGLRRGWSDELARAVAELPDVAYHCAPKESAARALLRECPPRHRMMIAIRANDGLARSVERRWIEEGKRPEKKGLALAGEAVGTPKEWGGGRQFGNLARLVELAKTGPVVCVLSEGAPDYLVLAGLALIEARTLTGRSFVALAACGHVGLPKIAEALRRELVAQAVSPQNLRMVFIPHQGDTDDCGVGSMREAAKILRGHCAGLWVDLPTGPDRKGDVADVAKGADDSVAALRAVLDSARELYRAPAVIAHAKASVPEVLAGVAAAVDRASGDTLETFSTPAGAGKTYAVGKKLSDVAPTLRRPMASKPGEDEPACTYMAYGSLAQATEQRTAFEARGYDCASTVLEGRLANCVPYQAAKEGNPPAAVRMKGYYESFGPRLCEGCEHDCGSSKPVPGAVNFCSHLRAQHEPRPGDLLIVDESPERLGVEEFPRAGFTSVTSSRVAKKWRNNYPEESEAFREVVVMLDHLAAETRREHESDRKGRKRKAPYRVRVDVAQLAAGEHDFKALIASALGDDAKRPPSAQPLDARRNGGLGYPDPKAWRGLLAVSSALDAAPELGVKVSLVVSSGTWELEVRTPLTFPEGVHVVVLDATADLIEPEWQKVAEWSGRELRSTRVDVTGAAPLHAFHTKMGAFRTTQIGHRLSADAFAWYDDVANRTLRSALASVACRHSIHSPLRDKSAGVITHKVLAEAMRGDDKSKGGQRIRSVVVEFEERGWKFDIGHYGRDERGSNRFQKLTHIVSLGASRAEMSAVQADAECFGLDWSEMYANHSELSAEQTIGRGRSIRRFDDPPVVHLFSDGRAPRLHGGEWTVEDARPGNGANGSTVDIVTACVEMFTTLGVVAPSSIVEATGAPRRTVERRVEKVAKGLELRGWHFRTHRGRLKVYAESRDVAVAWVESGRFLEKPNENNTPVKFPIIEQGPRPASRAVGPNFTGTEPQGSGGTASLINLTEPPEPLSFPGKRVREAAESLFALGVYEAGRADVELSTTMNALLHRPPGDPEWARRVDAVARQGQRRPEVYATAEALAHGVGVAS